VGKYKEKAFSELEFQFTKRFNFSFFVHELKASALNQQEENNLIEKKRIELGLNFQQSFLMTEKGKSFDTTELKNLVQKKSEEFSSLLFIIGGSFGFTETTFKNYSMQLALSPLTFPHQLARLILVEQLYRIQTIIQNHPYHH